MVDSLVRGFNWKCQMFNGAIFEFWTAWKISRKEALKKLLLIANGEYNPPIYTKDDIDHFWFNKNINK